VIGLRKRGSSSVRRWWWTLDSISLALILGIVMIGALLITTASPPVAEKLKLNSFYFVHRQFVFLVLALIIMITTAALSEKNLKRLVLLGFLVCIALMCIVLFKGDEVKGARRWLSIAGVSIQPSEILKTLYIFLIGLVLSEKFSKEAFPAFTICVIIHAIVCGLLILQPDFGMVITYTTVLAGQFFLAGLSIWWIVIVGLVGTIACVTAYFTLPHVAKRVDTFLNPDGNENYQVEKSIESYVNGGFFGKGPGEGTVKTHLPDSHTDFIFAVAGEEFGSIMTAVMMLVFLSLILRGLYLLYKEQNLFKIYVCAGIIILFALQTVFNIGVTLHIFPTKGMTLPFVSYGGSSVISFAICFGIFLNFTKKKPAINHQSNAFIMNTHVKEL